METNNSEKTLEILIGIFIILILVSVIQYLKPFITELQAQKRDPARIQDLSLMNSAIAKLQKINPNLLLGEPNKVYPIKSLQGKFNRVYISLPSSNTNCNGLELPSLPDSWEYRCKPESEFRKIDGNGWMPVDFTQLPKDFDFNSSLPIDSTSAADNGYYYAYIVGEKNDWVLTSLLESNKFLKQSALNDGGTDLARFEIGSDLQLWTKVSRLAGYWKFDEGTGQTAYDATGNGNNETLGASVASGSDDPKWTTGRGQTSTGGGLTSTGEALQFDGTNDYVNCGASWQLRKPYTFETWVKADTFKELSTIISVYEDASNYIQLNYRSDTTKWGLTTIIAGVSKLISSDATAQTGVWVHIAGTVDSSGNIYLYINGVKQAATDTTTDLTGTGTAYIGWLGYPDAAYYFDGLIDEVRIYNRALSETEIRAIYNATK